MFRLVNGYWRIGHFRVTVCFCFKTRLCAKPFYMKISLIYMKMNLKEELIFNEWFRVKPHFYTEAKGKLEMAYCWVIPMAFPRTERESCNFRSINEQLL